MAAILFCIVWATMMGSYFYFVWHVAPSALRRWAEEQGYQIIEKKMAGPLTWFRFAKGSGHHIYRVVVLDAAGQTRHALVRVGNPHWFCLSSSRCPVDVRWEASRESPGPVKPVSPRLVLGFAGADLLLAAFQAFWVVGFFVMAAVSADDVWNDALGLNRLLGRAPGPNALREAPMVLSMSLGFLALHLLGVIALAAGGIGLIWREQWGFYAHVTGSALVALTGFGLVYTVPSLIVAFRPGFRAYFREAGKCQAKPDPPGDL